MDRDESPLTDPQLEALDFLSADLGRTNRELTRHLKESKISSMLSEQEITKLLERIERDEGNIHRTVTKPLLKKGIIYQVKGKYPNKLLYINKFIDNLNKIQYDLADPIKGKIWHYVEIHHIEEAKSELGKTSKEHSKAHGVLRSFIHLYSWCDKIKREINNVASDQRQRYEAFCLVTQTPPCKSCRAIQRGMKIDQYYQEHRRILWHLEEIQSKRDLDKWVNDLHLVKCNGRGHPQTDGTKSE